MHFFIVLFLSFFFCDPSNATSMGHLDIGTGKYIIQTNFFFYGPAADEESAATIVHEISRLWNQPKVYYYRNGKAYPLEFHFNYAVNKIASDLYKITVDTLTKKTFAQSPDSKIFHFDLKNGPEILNSSRKNYLGLNLIEMTHTTANNKMSKMNCGSHTGFFVIENIDPNGTTFAHEFGHSLGLAHSLNQDCISETPSIMCARGSKTLSKYQYNPAKGMGASGGGTINPIFRVVRVEDILKLNIEEIPEDGRGYRMIGPHMKDACEKD